MKSWVTACLTMAVLLYAIMHGAEEPVTVDWPAYGGGPEGTRYSPLSQIDRSNVGQLRVAWSYDTNEGPGASQTQPIVVNGVLYGITPRHRVIALDAATGRLIWRFDSEVAGRGPNRGLTYWASGDDRRIFAAVRSYVYALNAGTGKPIPSFGDNGRIDLREGLGRDPREQSIALTTPGIIYRDLLIVGGRTPEALPAPPGDIRAYDVRTGRMRWAFHTIPRPGEFGYDTWPKDAWTYTGAANNWAGMALDEKRGIVYVPTGTAASDFYGADRLGDNLFADCMLALDAATGKRLWHFQAVKHDIWDRDFPSPPVLATIKRDGKTIDAVAQATKHGYLFVFDRVSGEPLFPIQYREYPPSEMPGEVTSKTQPLPLKPAPYTRQRLTEDMVTTRTPEARKWVLERLKVLQNGDPFTPFRPGQDTVLFPGYDGGAEWGGQAFDPETGLYYINANDLPSTGGLVPDTRTASGRDVYMRDCGACHGEDLSGSATQSPSLTGIGEKRKPEEIAEIIRQGGGRMPGFPGMSPQEVQAVVQYLITRHSYELESGAAAPATSYRFTGYRKFLDPDGYPAVKPPWGTLNAINLSTGEYAWKVPLGEYPELAAKGMKDTGTENHGGPIVTAGGLVFIAATSFDRKFRAFDKLSGKLLWEYTLPMAGNATPVTYQINGRQYVVIYATGGKGRVDDPTGGIYVAFALAAKR